MERILIRAGVAPWAEYNALDVITDKIIGNNTGNLLFANSITRLVATADSRVDFISDLMLVKKQITAQEINENYDRLILPMANAFREDFARKCLKHWTALIRQLTIPVTVTGIGIQLPYEPHLEQPREFDGAARDFIAAVLDHSASVGVRGQITYDYLKGLGFSQIDVTGCPSLALNGPGLPLREKQPLTPESKLCFTGSVSNPPDFKKFAVRCTERFPNTYFVPQFIDDLRLMYLGIPHPDTADSRVLHPTNLDCPVCSPLIERWTLTTAPAFTVPSAIFCVACPACCSPRTPAFGSWQSITTFLPFPPLPSHRTRIWQRCMIKPTSAR